jgi:hypothetical protein
MGYNSPRGTTATGRRTRRPVPSSYARRPWLTGCTECLPSTWLKPPIWAAPEYGFMSCAEDPGPNGASHGLNTLLLFGTADVYGEVTTAGPAAVAAAEQLSHLIRANT